MLRRELRFREWIIFEKGGVYDHGDGLIQTGCIMGYGLMFR